MFEIQSRQINMDFHLSGEIENVGGNFDGKKFTETLTKNGINGVTVFAKCHHGWFYYKDTKFSVHPHLKKDLLPEMIEACENAGIQPSVYISAGFDEVAAENHHDWVLKLKDGSTERARSFNEPGYHMMCFNSEYVDYLSEQIEEVMKKFNPHEVFLDICYERKCYCNKCRKEMIDRGMDPYNDNDATKFATEVYAAFCKKTTEAVRKYSNTTRIFYNGGHVYRGRRDLASYNTHFEIESLPTGGWGYEHFPLTVNYVEQLGKDYLGMTGKFNMSWGEFGGYKDKNALLYEAGLFMCYGAKCSVGDQINYDGTLDEHTYSIIGHAYNYVKKYESFVYPSVKTAEIGVWCVEASSGCYGPDTDRGVVKILLKGKYQFDFIDAESDLSEYRLIILPDSVVVKGKLKDKIDEFVKNGGKLLITGESAVEEGKLLYDVGAEFVGKDTLVPSYIDCENVIGDKAHNVIYSDSYDVKLTGKLIAEKYKPFMNREGRHFCSHLHWPENGAQSYPGITEGKDGIYVAYKIFEDFCKNAPCEIRKVMITLIDRLLGEKLIESNLPTQAIATLRTQDDRFILQTLYGIPYNAGGLLQVIDDIPYLYDTEYSILTGRKVKSVKTADGKKLPFKCFNGRVRFKLPKMWCHSIIVID